MLKICKLKQNAIIPSYQTPFSSGCDLHACLDDDVCIGPMKRVLIPTGLSFELPNGFEAQIRSRSGLSLKNGVFVLNSPGTIDNDYRGEICVVLMNLGEEDFVVKHGQRIAQMVFCKFEQFNLVEVPLLSSTERGSGGFGSTGS